METLRPEEWSPDEAVEAAGQVTERESAVARELEEQGRFREAAALYDQIAVAWQQAAAMLTGDRQHYFQSLVDYWAGRANTARERAAEESALALQAQSSQPPGKAETFVHDTSIRPSGLLPKRPDFTDRITKGPTRGVPFKKGPSIPRR